MVVPAEGAKREQGIENLCEKNDRKLPLPGEGNGHTSLGSTESPKQDERKEAHTKTHNN